MKNLKDMSDEELALSYMEGNNKAFDLLLEHTQSRLFSYILFIVRDEDVANDVFQDTFIKIIVKLRHRKYGQVCSMVHAHCTQRGNGPVSPAENRANCRAYRR